MTMPLPVDNNTLQEPLIPALSGDDDEARTTLRPSGRPLTRIQTFDKDGGDLDVYSRSLLPLEEVEEGGIHPSNPSALFSPGGGRAADTFTVTTISLSKVILGSGMLVRGRGSPCAVPCTWTNLHAATILNQEYS